MNRKMLLARLAQAAVILGEPADADRLEGYLGELHDLDPGECIEAINGLMREVGRKFLPSPGEVRGMVTSAAKHRALRAGCRPLLEDPGLSDEDHAAGIAYLDSLKEQGL